MRIVAKIGAALAAKGSMVFGNPKNRYYIVNPAALGPWTLQAIGCNKISHPPGLLDL
jgi:hypothetical protein